MSHLVRYKKTATDDWYHLPLIAGKAAIISYAKTIGHAELGQPAYHEVQVVCIDNSPVVWSRNESTVSSTDME